MEQRSDTNIQPVAAAGAGVDPAYVPGLVNLRAPEAEDTGTGAQTPPSPRSGGTGPAANAGGADADSDAPEPAKPGKPDPEDAAGTTDATDATDVADASDAAYAADTDEADDSSDGSADEGPDDGPSLEASDRRASITAGRRGVRFTLDDQEADFRWDEIGAVEVVVPRFGKRFGVVVHTHLRRSYEADAEAPSRAVLKEWNERLDAVLDAYFEDEDAEAAEAAEPAEGGDGSGDDTERSGGSDATPDKS
ncbi:hypothetical protein [Streptomyces sp. 8L]|uniref:hypothetical protein n=1 Tax=Streptomyces sp. 8L TaxID=2877242 RepID=UPI001CD3380A|nr:hypothetical protein [Streptomyces sp. 8L]MCA1220441.1 hypothetical protein [Streptomyces sp. 8L]